MFPDVAEVVRHAREALAALGSDAHPDERAIRLALSAAEQLADDTFDVPAALHFTFARAPRAFGAAHTQVLAALLDATATELGLRILTPRADLLQHLAQRPSDLQSTRDWFAERVVAFGG